MRHFLLAGVAFSMFAVPTAVLAQDTATETGAGATEGTSVDIIVTANRRSERLLDVPATVTAITGEDIQNLKIFKAADLTALSPGLTLNKPAAYGSTVSLRGLEFIPGSNQVSIVDFYFNDVVRNLETGLTSIYDVGQYEVLRGPQGTLRGRPTPSGSISLTTRRPDLDEFGGYLEMTATDLDAMNVQGAVSIPIVPGKVAVRFAGLMDESVGVVRSVNGGAKPLARTVSGRATLVARPVDELEIVATYQHLANNVAQYTQVFGPGNGTNGPALSITDRLAVSTEPFRYLENSDVVTLQATLDLPFNASLIYVGGYQDEYRNGFNTQNTYNTVPNFEQVAEQPNRNVFWTHELRLQSNGGKLIDYLIGVYSFDVHSLTDTNVVSSLNGAFGVGAVPVGPANTDYQLRFLINTLAIDRSKAVYGSVTIHATDKLDITAGARMNFDEHLLRQTRDAGSARTVIGVARADGTCAAGVPSVTYPGRCELPIATPFTQTGVPSRPKPFLYNASIKYAITDDINVYAASGSSFRPGANNPSIQPGTNPILLAFDKLPDEKSRNYEIGVKGAFFDRRLRVSAAVFQQDFDNLNTRLVVPYLSPSAVAAGDFNFAADARVRGVEVEIAGRPTNNFDFTLSGSYTDGRFRNAPVPCRDSNGDGVPDAGRPLSGVAGIRNEGNVLGPSTAPGALTAANPVAICVRNDEIIAQPKFTASLSAELRAPFGDNTAYLRTLTTYRAKVDDITTGYQVPDFALVNLYAGVRIGDTADISIFAKNLFDADVLLGRQNFDVVSNTVNSGYRTYTRTQPRELGVSFRAAWGSR